MISRRLGYSRPESQPGQTRMSQVDVETERQQAGRVRRLIVAITGASGVIYGIRALQLLRAVGDIETHVILTPAALRTIAEETDFAAGDVKALADRLYNFRDIGAAISSGSYTTIGMLVAPCSVKTLSGIANSYNDELVVRAADVCLKERRRVVLLFRETPLHAGHIDLLAGATRNGAIVMPPVPAYYHRPKSIDDIINQTVGRALDLFDIDIGVVKRWTGQAACPENGSL
jgi:flavin prenyltransferase